MDLPIIFDLDTVFTEEELRERTYSDSSIDRRLVAHRGENLDILVYDKDYYVRMEVARQGYGHDILVHDNSPVVRREVARHGHYLDILVKDVNVVVQRLAQYLYDATVVVVARNFGTYHGNIYLYVWKKSGEYEIRSGCYTARSLSEWEKKCEERLGKKEAHSMSKTICKELNRIKGTKLLGTIINRLEGL